MTSNRVGTGVLTENAEEEEVTEEERVRTERLNPFSFSSASVTLGALCENSGARSGIMNGGLESLRVGLVVAGRVCFVVRR